GVGAAPAEPRPHLEGFEEGDPPFRPPLLPDGAPSALRLDAVFDLFRLPSLVISPVARHHRSSPSMASRLRARTSRRSSVESSVSHASPAPTTASASSF